MLGTVLSMKMGIYCTALTRRRKEESMMNSWFTTALVLHQLWLYAQVFFVQREDSTPLCLPIRTTISGFGSAAWRKLRLMLHIQFAGWCM